MSNTYFITFSLLFLCLFACNEVPQTADTATPPSIESPQMVWSDEFDYTGLPDSNKWYYDIGDGCDLPAGCGWGNNELQYYTHQESKNTRVENGYLIIEAHREKYKESAYTSGRLLSKQNWQYGRLEIRAKLPTGRGTWPAIWMLPKEDKYGGWPSNGEIDIMEHVGYEPDTIYGTVHTKAYNHIIGTQKSGQIYLSDSEAAFHTYAIDWTAESIAFSVDDQVYFTFENEGTGIQTWPFDQPFYLIMNIAVGGGWGGKHGVDESIWPQQMEVDYVRVYQ